MRYLNLIFIFGILTSAAQASASCRDGKWTPVEGKLMMALRSNSCHFWAWAAENDKMLPKGWLDSEVLVTGDPHHENFSYVTIRGKREYVPNDLDDTGTAPAILEFLKFAGVARSVQEKEKDLSTAEMVDAYLAGLEGKRFTGEFSKFLEKDRDVSAEKIREDEQKDVDGKEKDGKFKEKDNLVRKKNLDKVEEREFDLLDETFVEYLPKRWEILDRALHSKKDDGSDREGALRYWYLVKDTNGDKHIIEFKELREPAVYLYQRQIADGKERMEKSLKVYWGSLPANFAVVKTERGVFWMRPKLPNYVDFSVAEFRRHEKRFARLSNFIAYNLGRWHGEQLGKTKVGRLNLTSEALTEFTEKFVDNYLKDVQKKHKD